MSDELATFLEGMNNYSKSDQASNYLTFWSNKEITIDRVSKPIPLVIKQPFLNIIGSLQPRILNKLFPANKTDNGFMQRFLFAFPDIGENHSINDVEINLNTIDQYNKFICEYIENHPIKIKEETKKVDSKIYFWSDDAKEYFYEWHRIHTIQLNKNADTLLGEVISKFDIHFVRIALILQIMENNFTNQISLNAVTGAEALCKYFLCNAIKVLDIIDKKDIPVLLQDKLNQNKHDLYLQLPNDFTTAQANEIGAILKLNDKFVQRLIGNTSLFKRVSHGNYSKIITD